MTAKLLLSETRKAMKGRWGDAAAAFFVQAVMRMAALAPLVALATKAKAVALICPVLIVLVIMPLRFSFAQTLDGFVKGDRLFSPRMVSFEGYFKKLRMALFQILKILLYAIPFFALVAYVINMWFSVPDGLTMIRQLVQLGGGSVESGIMVFVLIVALLLVPVMIGLSIHSGDRFFFISAQKKQKGTGKAHFKCALFGFLILLPMAIPLVIAILNTAIPVIKSMFKDTSGLQAMGYWVAAAVCYYALTLPIRKLLPAVLFNHEA